MIEEIYAARKYIKKHQNAQKSGIEFTLTLSEFRKIVSRKKCFYTGVLMNKPIGEHSKDWHDLTLDRIDSSKGYIKGNVVACIKAANNLKAIWENPDFKLTPKNAMDIAKKTVELIESKK
jgi:hypothetical protein